MALKLLYQKIQKGTWTWPGDVKVSLQCFEFLTATMQFDPLNRPSWQEMRQHAFFTQNSSQMVPLEIIFDEEPPKGIEFKNGKIYVNTKNPQLYQELHQQAIKTYIEENNDAVEGALNDVLVQQAATKDLFPRISKDLTKDSQNSQSTISKSAFETKETVIEEGKDNENRASVSMGIHEFE